MRKPSPRPSLMNNLSEADRNHSAADRGLLQGADRPHMRINGPPIILMMIGGYSPVLGDLAALDPWLVRRNNVSTTFGLPSPPST